MTLLRSCQILLSGILLILAGCTDAPKEPLRIGAVLWPGYEPLYLASKLNYFQNQPIKIIDYLSNTDAIQAFNNHNLNAAAFTLDETLQVLDTNNDIDIVLIMDTSNGGDVILANPGINSVKDLKNKPVAVESSAVGAYVLKRALQLNDMTFDDIQIVSTNAMEQLSAFEQGKAVAAVTFDPYRTKILKTGKKEIFNSTQIPDEVIDVLVVRKQYLKKNPEVIAELIRGWFKALEYQNQYPEESAAYSIKRFNNTSEEYIASLKLLNFVSAKKNHILLNSKNSPLLNQQKDILSILNDLGLTKNNPDLNNSLNDRFIP